MALLRRQLPLVIAFAAFLGGCARHTNLTATPEVEQSGILGTRLRTTQDLYLLKDRPSGTLRLVTEDYPCYPRNHRLGVVEAGTHLEVDRVARVTELAGFMVLPFYHTWTCTLAQIRDGRFAGERVAVDGMLSHEQTATLRSKLLAAEPPHPSTTRPRSRP